MIQDHAKAFATVADICSGYAVDAAKNIKLLREVDATGTSFQDLFEIDTKKYQTCLVYETAREKRFRVLGGIIPKTKKYTPFGLTESFALHCDIVRANAMVAFGRKRPGLQQLAAADFDRILWRSWAVAAAYRHASRIEEGNDVGKAIDQMAGVASKVDPLTSERFANADLALKRLLQIYVCELNSIPSAVREVAWNFVGLRQQLRAIPANPLPVWVGYKDHDGSKFVNDIWIPQQYADHLMKDLAMKQAETSRT